MKQIYGRECSECCVKTDRKGAEGQGENKRPGVGEVRPIHNSSILKLVMIIIVE